MDIKKLIALLTSLRVSICLLSCTLLLLFAGALVMPVREEFRTIHSAPLFQWILNQPLSITWWLWGTFPVIVLLTINTISCSIESLVKKSSLGQWLLKVSPQIIHLGFLFILLAHLMSSMSGFKGMAVAGQGTSLSLPNGATLLVKGIAISVDPQGYIRDWAVDVEYTSEGTSLAQARLMPNRPSFHGGIGVYVKDIQAFPERAVLLEISREPGAPWALAGGILFMAGTLTLLVLKMRREARPL